MKEADGMCSGILHLEVTPEPREIGSRGLCNSHNCNGMYSACACASRNYNVHDHGVTSLGIEK